MGSFYSHNRNKLNKTNMLWGENIKEYINSRYPVDIFIGLGRQEIHITLSNLKEVNPLSESLVKATKLSSLAHPYFELDIEQDKMYKPLLMKQETEQLE